MRIRYNSRLGWGGWGDEGIVGGVDADSWNVVAFFLMIFFGLLFV